MCKIGFCFRGPRLVSSDDGLWLPETCLESPQDYMYMEYTLIEERYKVLALQSGHQSNRDPMVFQLLPQRHWTCLDALG